MQEIEVHHEVTHDFQTPVHGAIGFFREPTGLARCTPHVTAYERVDATTVDYTLETHRAFGLTFKPRYRLHYVWETERTLTWSTVPIEGGTVQMAARVQFLELSPERCRIEVEERITFSLPVTFITAKIVQVMARRKAARDMETLLRTVDAALTERAAVEAAS